MSCPIEFENKKIVNPWILVGVGGAIWLLSGIIMAEIFSPYLPIKELEEVYILGAKLLQALCLIGLISVIGIDTSTVIRNWLSHWREHWRIVLRYYVVYVGFLLLIMGVLSAILILLVKTGAIDYSTFINAAAEPDIKDRMVRVKFLLENSIPLFIVSLIYMCILGPVIEEIFFRRFLFVALRKRMNFALALFTSSAFFMAVHPNIALGAIGGIYLGYVYEKGKSLPANILIHSITNLTVITISMMLA
ncbi:MAG: CPBP family intramembrane metalloprotease [Elusimicrobia bacterium]|nr:CPBP family intramembrane metalloprotease [Elusimicrobiota bacterium]